MKKKNYDGMGAEECRDLNWVELSEKLDAKDGSAGMVDAISYSDPEDDIPDSH